MVDIDFIKTTSCPVCGCHTVIHESIEVEFNSTKIRRHCNGGKWETRRFACGYEVRYVPNFSCESHTSKCKYDPEVARIEKQQSDLKNELVKIIETSECSDYYKELLRNRLGLYIRGE